MSPHTDAGALLKLADRIKRSTVFFRSGDPPRPSVDLTDAEKQLLIDALLRQAVSHGREGGERSEVQTIELMARESDAEIARITGLLFDQINENKSLRAAQAPFDPVAWRCKDYADGWIYTSKLQEAQNYQATTGCLMQPLYAGPIALSSGQPDAAAQAVQEPKPDIIGVLRSVHSALDDALGDTDVSHIENDDELRDECPVQWAAGWLAHVIELLEDSSPVPSATCGGGK